LQTILIQKNNAAAQAAVLPKIPSEDASWAFKKALIERALGAEMSHHLGYTAGADKSQAATNHQDRFTRAQA